MNDLIVHSEIGNRENYMEERKLALIQKLEEKGIPIDKAAEAIEFNPALLALYLVKDAYPVPTRILDKLEQVVSN